MADIALKSSSLETTSNQYVLDIVESIEQDTRPAGEDLPALCPVKVDSVTGKWLKADATSAGNAKAYGVTVRQVKSGFPVTAIAKGILGGADVSALGYGADV